MLLWNGYCHKVVIVTRRKPIAVSMDPEFEALAKTRAKTLGFSTFSGYVNQLLRADVLEGGPIRILVQPEKDSGVPLPSAKRKSGKSGLKA